MGADELLVKIIARRRFGHVFYPSIDLRNHWTTTQAWRLEFDSAVVGSQHFEQAFSHFEQAFSAPQTPGPPRVDCVCTNAICRAMPDARQARPSGVRHRSSLTGSRAQSPRSQSRPCPESTRTAVGTRTRIRQREPRSRRKRHYP